MGFSSQQYRKEQKERPWKINPAWRGIGCILFLLVPVMAWVGASLLLQTYQNVPLPGEMNRVFAIPFIRIAGTVISEINGYILQINHYFQAIGFKTGQLFFTVIFMFVGYGIMAFVYAMMYKVAGPPRYGPFDVPPNSIKRYH